MRASWPAPVRGVCRACAGCEPGRSCAPPCRLVKRRVRRDGPVPILGVRLVGQLLEAAKCVREVRCSMAPFWKFAELVVNGADLARFCRRHREGFVTDALIDAPAVLLIPGQAGF